MMIYDKYNINILKATFRILNISLSLYALIITTDHQIIIINHNNVNIFIKVITFHYGQNTNRHIQFPRHSKQLTTHLNTTTLLSESGK